MRLRWFGAALSSLLVVSMTSASAEDRCSERTRVLEFLAENYQEAPISRGIANNGGLIEVLTSRDGSTWTILITMPDGQTCMVAAGSDWGQLPSAVQSAEIETDPGA